MKKLKINHDTTPALTINRNAIESQNELVYLALANRPLNYSRGKSRIVYIGTTKTGSHRLTQSASERANELLKLHGVTSLDFHIVTCSKPSSSNEETKEWKVLESAFLIKFLHRFGETPKCNKTGHLLVWEGKVSDFFEEEKIRSIINEFSELCVVT